MSEDKDRIGDVRKQDIIDDLLLLHSYLNVERHKRMVSDRLADVDRRIESLRRTWKIPDPFDGYFWPED